MGSAIAALGEQMLGNAAQQATGGLMGMLFQGGQDRRQVRQQEKLQNLQIKGQKEMTDYEFMKQLQMWKDTNYSAQMGEIEKAGLNAGLLYGMGGQGGMTTGKGGGSVQGAHAPSGGGEVVAMAGQAANMALMNAQRENIEADTANKKADTANKPLQGEQVQASTMSILQGIDNQQAQAAKTRIETDIATIEKRIKGETADDAIQLVSWEEQQMGNQVEQLYRQNVISKATMGEAIDQIKVNLAATVIHNEMMKAQTTNINQQTQVGIAEVKSIIQKMVTDMRGDKRAVEGTEMERTDKNHKQWVEDIQKSTGLGTDVVEKVIQGIILKNLISPQGNTPIRGFHNR